MLTYNEIVNYVERHIKQGDVYIETGDITNLDGSDIDKLGVGDVVVKMTGSMKHGYMVTYKQDKHGICLTYVDASCVETISYDYIGNQWIYNSKDVTIFDNLIKANPVLAGTEGNLTSIDIKGNKYKVSTVEPNVATTSDTPTINSLGIDGLPYKLPIQPLYYHKVVFSASILVDNITQTLYYTFDFYNYVNKDDYTINELSKLLYDMGIWGTSYQYKEQSKIISDTKMCTFFVTGAANYSRVDINYKVQGSSLSNISAAITSQTCIPM